MGIWQIKAVAVSADGLHVFASGRKDPAQPKGSLARFTRNPATGALTFAEAQFDDLTFLVTGLGAGGPIAVSPAGDSVYVASPLRSALVVFDFDEGSSTLTYRETLLDGVEGVDGLAGATGPALSADGANVYVAGGAGDELGVFTRDPGTGGVTFLEAHHDLATAQGLDGANDVAVHPSGAYLYVASTAANAVSVFQRHPGTGALGWLDQAVQGVGGVDGIAGASSVAVSPDGQHVYVAGPAGSAVAIFGPGEAWDFGDAADPSYPTLLASDGARHLFVPGFFLGASVDVEADGQPSADADGDDLAGIDDGDGIVFVSPLVPGQPATVEVTASAAGALDAWADWNGDGDWADAGEQIAAGAALAAGVNPVGILVDAAAVPDSIATARFRLRLTGDPALAPGGAAASGEVEDYRVAVGRGADLGVTATGTANSDWQQPFTFTITVGNGGPNDVTGATVTVGISANGGNVSWTCVASGGTCTAAGAGDIADVVDLVPGGTLVYTIDGVVPDQAPGPWVTATAAVAVPAGVVDPVPSNDTAVANVLIRTIFLDGFETGDTSRWSFGTP
jgi:6-phosphogluconolactonase (cycloisomerase 2 family)